MIGRPPLLAGAVQLNVTWPSPAVATGLLGTPGARTTVTGTKLVVVVLLPSWPEALLPQHRMRPSVTAAHACELPVATSVAPVIPAAVVGELRSALVPSPSSPEVLLPQHLTAPDPVAAHPNLAPESMALTSAKVIDRAPKRSVLVPSPSWPRKFAPQQRTAGDDVLFWVQVWDWPSAKLREVTKGVRDAWTVTGVVLVAGVLAPIPSWPPELAPQQEIAFVNALMDAQVCHCPAPSATTPDVPDTVTGRDDPVVVPLPSCPNKLLPQHRTAPAETAQVWVPPTV